ncbi:MAG TPA: protein-glutamate O-methyltransferase CheR [bacterium]|nr:protein-glutamate O-methyltransferase CheR [bacterium]HPQ19593.1 protein-glutamate O-methyltransferase CheR [bacterium]
MIAQSEKIIDDKIESILSLIFEKTGNDYSQYKRGVIIKRIRRRMSIVKCSDLDEYLKYLLENEDEIINLHKSFTIKVTNFFRDLNEYKTFNNLILPELIKNKYFFLKENNLIQNENEEYIPLIKVWSVGCSIGCEPYSLAILFHRYLNLVKKKINIQILATDIDDDSLEYAKKGVFEKYFLNDIPIELFDKYFIRTEAYKYTINNEVKNLVEFQKHSIISDKLFYGFDLIICRNLIIYFLNSLQNKILTRLINSLNIGGYLWLGKSEFIPSSLKHLVRPINNKTKIYIKI